MVNEIKQRIQKLDTLSIIVLLLLILAAAMSFGNVKDFFNSHEADTLTAWAGAFFFSLVLITLAWVLSEATPRWAFDYIFIVVVTVGFAALSGLFQTTMYFEHRPDAGFINYAAGFGIPMLGEVGLAVVAVLFRKMEQKRRFMSIREEMAGGVQYIFAESMRTVDPDLIKAEVQKEVRKFARTMISMTLDDMYTELSANRPKTQLQDFSEMAQNSIKIVESELVSERKKSDDQSKLERMQAGRLSKIERRRQQILSLVEQGETAIADALEHLGVSENTVRNDVQALRGQGHNIDISNGVLAMSY